MNPVRHSFLFVFHCLLFTSLLFSQNHPYFLTEVDNLSAYVHFGTSGWDGNWYVGFNSTWYVELSSVPARDSFKRAFIGAKLGRAKYKDAEDAKSVWDKEPIRGEIYIALNSTPVWSAENSFLLARVEDLPKEGHPEMPLDEVGEARWFFIEVPVGMISKTEYNYIAVWSTTSALNSAASSPIMTSAIGGKNSRFRTFITNTPEGSPPSAPVSDGKMISFYESSLCIKLVPENDEIPQVEIADLKKGDIDAASLIRISAAGKDIYRAWLEISNEKTGGFKKTGFYQYSPPFIFSIPINDIVPGKNTLRAAVSNIFENTGYSQTFMIEQ